MEGKRQLLLGGFGHRTGDEDESITGYRQLELFLHNSFAGAGGKPTYGWSAQDCMPIDGLPYIGAIDSHARLYAATGYAKWGMTNATAAAIMIVDSITGSGNLDKDVRGCLLSGTCRARGVGQRLFVAGRPYNQSIHGGQFKHA